MLNCVLTQWGASGIICMQGNALSGILLSNTLSFNGCYPVLFNRGMRTMKINVYLNKDLDQKIEPFAKKLHVSKAQFVRMILQMTDWDTLASVLELPLGLVDKAIDEGQMTIDEVLNTPKELKKKEG